MANFSEIVRKRKLTADWLNAKREKAHESSRYFNADQIREIRELAANGMSNKDIARTRCVAEITIYKIVTRATYKEVE